MRNLVKRFYQEAYGNFATIFAIATLPIMLSAGGAIDYTRMFNDKAKVQNALDAAVLAAGKEINKLSKIELRKMVKAFVEGELEPSLYAQINKVTVEVDKESGTIRGFVNAKTKTSFIQLAGIKELKFKLVSQVSGPFGGAEIILVLDNTYSMSVEGKMDALKTASTDFIDALLDDDGTNGTKIGIVPFSNHVNVGLHNRNASWLDVEDDSTVTDPNACYKTRPIISKSSCVEQTADNDGVPYTYETCDYEYGEEVEICEPKTTTTTWTGCVGSREDGLSLLDKKYNTNKVPGLMNTWCGRAITPLTSDKEALKSEIEAMIASNETYIPSGLTWGMRALSSKPPFAQATSSGVAEAKSIKKFLILMTDGDNQRSAQLPDHPWHWGDDLNQADKWTNKVCDNIKKDGITVFSISFGSLTSKTKNLIKQCASSNQNYFHASSNKALIKAFDSIGKSIFSLHLSM